MTPKIFKDGDWLDTGFEIIEGQRTVAFLDILGFKNLIKGFPTNSLGRKYEAVITQINRLNKPSDISDRKRIFTEHPIDVPYCKTFFFSDSIIMISNGPSQTEAFKTLLSAWRTVQHLIINDLPVRGAVAFGDMYINQSRNIFLGKALTRAAELEKEQEWVGAVIDSNVFDSFPELKAGVDNKSDFLNRLFRKYPVPLKDSKITEAYTLNWRASLMLEKGAKSLFRYTGNPSIDIKYDNAMKYAVEGKSFLSQEEAPIELAVAWVGSEPPFLDPDPTFISSSTNAYF